MKERTLLGLPVVEVDDMPGPVCGDIVFGPLTNESLDRAAEAMGYRGLVIVTKIRPGLHTMEEMRDG